MTRRYLHDCEYANIGEIRAGVVEAAKLKKNLYMNRIPRRTEDITHGPTPSWNVSCSTSLPA